MLRDTLNTLGTFQAAAVRVLAYLLDREAKEVHTEQFYLVGIDYDGDGPDEGEQASWEHVMNALF